MGPKADWPALAANPAYSRNENRRAAAHQGGGAAVMPGDA